VGHCFSVLRSDSYSGFVTVNAIADCPCVLFLSSVPLCVKFLARAEQRDWQSTKQAGRRIDGE